MGEGGELFGEAKGCNVSASSGQNHQLLWFNDEAVREPRPNMSAARHLVLSAINLPSGGGEFFGFFL
jgi:hypothetical protein